MRLLTCALVVLATALVGSAHADDGSLTDMLTPREIALGEALRGGATDASAIALNPSGLPLARDMVFSGGYGYRTSDQANLIHAAACDATAPMPGCFYYDYAGSNPDLSGMSLHRHTHIAGSVLAYPIAPRFFIGAGLKYFNFSSDVMNEKSTSGFNWDLGATLRLTDLVNVGVTGYNLWGAESPELPRAVGGGFFAQPVPMLAISFDARWKLSGSDHSARYGGGAELFFSTHNNQTGFPIRLGALHDSGLGVTYLSAGLGLASMKYSVDIAARRSISGPEDTLFIASLSFFGPRLATPSPSAPVDEE